MNIEQFVVLMERFDVHSLADCDENKIRNGAVTNVITFKQEVQDIAQGRQKQPYSFRLVECVLEENAESSGKVKVLGFVEFTNVNNAGKHARHYMFEGSTELRKIMGL